MPVIEVKKLEGTSPVTHEELIYLCKNHKDYDLTQLDTSRIIDMQDLFNNQYEFNQDISNWNVSKVIIMEGIFYKAYSFNQDISKWDVSKVINMNGMFYKAYSFNQDINNWNVSAAVNMRHMFYAAYSFNQNLDKWDVSKVMDMSHMFAYANSFNKDINNWNIEINTAMTGMFEQAISFDTTKFKYKTVNIPEYSESNTLKIKEEDLTMVVTLDSKKEVEEAIKNLGKKNKNEIFKIVNIKTETKRGLLFRNSVNSFHLAFLYKV